MANWVIQTAETYLKPFSDAFLAELLRQAAIHADETVVQVNKEPGRDATAESRIWAYASTKRAERQIRYFHYEQSRKGACAEKVLRGYKGVVISDGYSGYGILSEATRAGCLAHAWRKWIEAMPQGATQENALATKGLEYCSRLFEVEQKLGDLSDAERQEQRRLLSGPIVSEYYAWLQTIFKPTGKLKKAIFEMDLFIVDNGEALEMSTTDLVRFSPLWTALCFGFIAFGLICLLVLLVKLVAWTVRKARKTPPKYQMADRQILIQQAVYGVSGAIFMLYFNIVGFSGRAFTTLSCILAAALALLSLVNGILLCYNTIKANSKALTKVKRYIWAALGAAYAAFILVMQLYNFWNL